MLEDLRYMFALADIHKKVLYEKKDIAALGFVYNSYLFLQSQDRTLGL